MAGNKALDVWREIPDFTDYEVSETGKIRRLKIGGSPIAFVGRELKPNNYGRYQRVCLFKNSKRHYLSIHRLVAIAFIGQRPSNKHQIAHNDGNSYNNNFRNLRWATAKENAADREKHGNTKKGEECANSKFKDGDIRRIRKMHSKGFFQNEIARIFKTSQSHIGRIVNGSAWGHIE